MIMELTMAAMMEVEEMVAVMVEVVEMVAVVVGTEIHIYAVSFCVYF